MLPKDPWKRVAKHSFRRAARPQSKSGFWTNIGIAASLFHLIGRAHGKKTRVVWRGRLRTGEQVIITQGMNEQREQ